LGYFASLIQDLLGESLIGLLKALAVGCIAGGFVLF
jgi:hypothetical protein